MKKLINNEAVSRIKMTKTVYPMCPIGKDTYRADIYIEMVLTEYYPEYMEFTAELEKIGAKEKTIEELARAIAKLCKEYEPEYGAVIVDAESNRHLDVTVTVEF